MRISLDHHLLGLGTGLVAAELAPRDKELLIRRKAVYRRRRCFSLLRFLKGEVGDLHAAKVAYALTQNQLAVYVNVAVDGIAIELPRNTRCLLVEVLEIFVVPPVLQPPLSVKLRALIVESVTDLMTDYYANRTIVHSVG